MAGTTLKAKATVRPKVQGYAAFRNRPGIVVCGSGKAVHVTDPPTRREETRESQTLERRGGQSSKLSKSAEKGSGPYVNAEGSTTCKRESQRMRRRLE